MPLHVGSLNPCGCGCRPRISKGIKVPGTFEIWCPKCEATTGMIAGMFEAQRVWNTETRYDYYNREDDEEDRCGYDGDELNWIR